MECIISIELGTNAVRVYAFDVAGKMLGFSKGAYPTFHPHADYSEQDPEQIFITMLYVVKNFLSEKIHAKNYRVLSVCFSASMHSLLAIDKNGVPLGHAITWADNRGKKEAGELRQSSLGQNMYKATGTPIHPMSPLIKIKWIRNNNPEIFKKASMFLSIKSYIIQQLTGRFIIDLSLASATGLLNIHSRQWDTVALDYAEITAKQLSELVPISYSECKLLRQYQVSLGLSANTKIIVGSSDGCLATLGAGVLGENKATITIEDSGAMRIIGTQVLKDKAGRLFNYILDDKYYVSGGPSNNGGVVFDWFASQFGDVTQAYDIEYSQREMLLHAGQVTAGCDGLIFLPYLLGERAPIWNANARGVYFGVNINHERKHFIRATMEGIVYEMYSIARILLEHRCIHTISVNGSFATIPLVTQMLADIFNTPMCAPQNVNAVSTGAFLLSATTMGIYPDLEEAARSVTLPEPFVPNKANQDLYAKYFPLFEKLTESLGNAFEELAGV